LAHGADPNILDGALNTPLTIACSTNGPESIDILMSFGADHSIASFKGNYPLHKCLYRGNLECFDRLIKYSKFYRLFRCFVDPDTSVVNNQGFTALDTLLNNHREESLQHLINKRDNEGWDIPYDLDLSKQLFTRNHQCSRIMLDTNSYRCLSTALTLMLMNLPEEEVNAINTSLVKYFIKEGYLRAMVLGHYQSASIITEFLEQEGV
jgi:ankyrin repeat protein